MAVLSADKQRPVRLLHGELTTYELPLAGYTNFGGGSATHTVYHGSIVVCDVSDTDGYFRACPLYSSVNAAAGDIFGGIALEQVTVAAADAADGSKVVRVAANGAWGFPVGSLAQTDIGAAIYATDDDNVGTSSTNTYWIGYLIEVDSSYAWVNIEPAFMRANTAT